MTKPVRRRRNKIKETQIAEKEDIEVNDESESDWEEGKKWTSVDIVAVKEMSDTEKKRVTLLNNLSDIQRFSSTFNMQLMNTNDTKEIPVYSIKALLRDSGIVPGNIYNKGAGVVKNYLLDLQNRSNDRGKAKPSRLLLVCIILYSRF